MPRRIAIDFGAQWEKRKDDDAHRKNQIYGRMMHNANQFYSLRFIALAWEKILFKTESQIGIEKIF